MPTVYQARFKAAALENIKGCQQRLRAQLGTSRVGERLARLDAEAAGELANAILALLDAVDAVVQRAKPAE